ncbi:A/G-specific adenine glycosylase [uncultured Endozoicomonas sp.]|uniref:A/G-specific adenine glycosylase n=1 Tax=uncultured Endozoicomonas sp. TaxID=432652 RepID=UPI0026223368|nr:A/G-specific adenine glycosylase [uncultured Endozoicomonas sp.]
MTIKDEVSTQVFSQKILRWFDHHGRKNLPWQQNKTPYRVWISEIMLQQTQVTTVIPYYQKFMARFPDVFTLAAAHEDEVLHHWSGLGYYSRARNLHKAAKAVVAQFDGEFPKSVEQLMELSGIGRSTAGAIASISMGIRAPIMDGNVKRVLTRYFAIPGWPGQTTISNQLWELADQLTPDHRTGDYTQVMMDLGATVCKRSKPTCDICPVSDDCVAHRLGQEKLYPESKPKKAKPEKSTIMLMVVNQFGEILLEKRPPSGIWGGLWGFPEVLGLDQVKEQAKEKTGLQLGDCDFWQPFRHTFSHYHLDITPALSFIEYPDSDTDYSIKDGDSLKWFPLATLPELGLAAPVSKLLGKLQKAL